VQCEPKLGFGLTKDSHGLITTQALITKNTHVHSASTTFHGPFIQTAKKSQNPKIPLTSGTLKLLTNQLLGNIIV
jgi:hypothetical protein